MPKRDRKITKGNKQEEDEKDDEEVVVSDKTKRLRTDEEEEEEDGDEIDSEGEEYDSDESPDQSGSTFVAWLKEGATSLSVGELHFSNVEHIGSPDADDAPNNNNAYCVVCELKLMPPCDDENKNLEEEEDEEQEEPPLVFTFEDSFPFRVIPSSSCVVGIPLEPNDDEEEDDDNTDSDDEPICMTYAMDAIVHESLLEELLDSRVSQNWQLPIPNDNNAVIDGLNAWWKAGEAKTGWDLSKIPKEDFTTLETIRSNSDDDDKDDKNILLRLYKDLCAFQPLLLTAELTRDDIEDRFEWRTCLCTYFAWAVPNEAALNTIANLKQPILEIGAGTGYWAWMLSQRGVDIVAYDLAESQGGQKHRFRHSMVQDGGVEQASLALHAGRALFLCWPDIVGDSAHDDADRGSFGVDTLRAYQGDTIVYVGELGSASSDGNSGAGVVRAAKGWGDPFPPGGSSASAVFQEELLANFRLHHRVVLPNWTPYNSHLTVWVRRK